MARLSNSRLRDRHARSGSRPILEPRWDDEDSTPTFATPVFEPARQRTRRRNLVEVSA